MRKGERVHFCLFSQKGQCMNVFKQDNQADLQAWSWGEGWIFTGKTHQSAHRCLPLGFSCWADRLPLGTLLTREGKRPVG